MERIHKGFDGATRELEAARLAPSCIENCGLCCLQNTPHAWDIEGRYIISVIMGNGALKKTIDRCESWLLDRHPDITTYGMSMGKVDQSLWERRLQGEVQKAMGLPCPFLESNRCAIYFSRPISCRAYGITRMSHPWCRRPIGVGETEIRKAYYAGEGATSLSRRINNFISGLSPEWRKSWFLPSLLYALLEPAKFKALAEDGKVASAKLIVGSVSPNIIWQGQLTELKRA